MKSVHKVEAIHKDDDKKVEPHHVIEYDNQFEFEDGVLEQFRK
jgi:hypothetical protein